jgi:site-specific DNA-methyltransferase (adenine-specific)
MKQETENLTLESPEPVANVETRAVGSSDWLGSVSVTNEDCMALMRRYPDKHFDLAIVDPPYGINVGDNKSGMGRRKGDAKATYKMGDWDAVPPPPEYFAELRRVSRNQIIWGVNHFISAMPWNSPCWIIWDKKFSNEVSFAAVEMAWTSFDSTAKRFECHPLQPDRIHPTQKPVALYQWLLANYAEKGQRILDTHLGSGSHAIACHYAGMHLTACELDPDYFKAAQERIARETAQTTLF